MLNEIWIDFLGMGKFGWSVSAIILFQALVEKMIRLQRTLARKQEKIEFMEEHSATLVEDIKKKNRLIQNYVLNKETSGALTSSSMDQNKVRLPSKIITQGILTFSDRILFPMNTHLIKKML